MKQTVSQWDFVQAFDDYNRSNNFSVAGREALYDYLTEYEESTGEELELDPIAVCCDFSEYESASEAAHEYGDFNPEIDDDESSEDFMERREEEALEWLQDRTIVIEFDGGVIIQCF